MSGFAKIESFEFFPLHRFVMSAVNSVLSRVLWKLKPTGIILGWVLKCKLKMNVFCQPSLLESWNNLIKLFWKCTFIHVAGTEKGNYWFLLNCHSLFNALSIYTSSRKKNMKLKVGQETGLATCTIFHLEQSNIVKSISWSSVTFTLYNYLGFCLLLTFTPCSRNKMFNSTQKHKCP